MKHFHGYIAAATLLVLLGSVDAGTKIKINPKPAENNGTFDTLKSAFGKGGKGLSTGARQIGSSDRKFGAKRFSGKVRFGGTVKGSSKHKSGELGSRTRQRAIETGLIEEGDAAAGHETAFGLSKHKSGELGSRTRQRAIETGLIEEGDAAAGHETAFERKHPDK